MFEHRSHPPLSRRAFFQRLLGQFLIAMVIILVSLSVGVLGYHTLEGLPWIDSLLNASMILGGMGEVDPLKTDAGKIFASLYALYSGLIVIVTAGVMLSPVFHRVLHKFHWESRN